MKKIILAVSVAALFFTACSNSEDFETPQPQKEIALNPVAQKATRTPINGTKFDDNQKIYVSAWNSVSKDYFKNIEFSQASGETTWKANQFWPINGVTSFLAYAFTPAGNSVMDANTAVWGNKTSTSSSTYENWAKQVSFAFVDDASNPTTEKTLYHGTANAGAVQTCATTPTTKQQQEGTPYVDLLYANADQTKEKDYQTVNMEFKHSGAWIVFHVKLGTDISTNNAALKINTFKLLNVHKGGILNIDNKVVGGAKAAWDFRDIKVADYAVESFPQTTGLDLDGTTNSERNINIYAFGAILPEQQQTAIQFKYTLSSTNSAFEPQTATYTHNLDRFNKWEMGKKYVYNITISFSEILIEPKVTDWESTSDTNI